MLKGKHIRIIGAPIDLAAVRRGVDMGPSAIRVANIGPRLAALGCDVEDVGNILVTHREAVTEIHPDNKARFLPQIAAALAELKEAVYRAVKDGRVPLVLGGDHSLSIGSVAGVTKHHGAQMEKIGVIWLDAHGNINTPETTITGNVHGMPLAHILGIGSKELLTVGEWIPMIDPVNTVLVGTRDLDPGERIIIRSLGVRVFTMRDIDEMGMKAVVHEATKIATNGTAGFHLSLGLDCLDPSVAPGVGTPVRGGMSSRDGRLAMEIISDSKSLLSMDVVEVNPVLDISNQTADLAVELTLSAFGKRLL